jgi:hypothetical protein
VTTSSFIDTERRNAAYYEKREGRLATSGGSMSRSTLTGMWTNGMGHYQRATKEIRVYSLLLTLIYI